MAAVIDRADAVAETTAHVSFPIIKTQKTSDGDLIVYGRATDGTVDADAQIVDPAWSAKALGEWLESGGNLRVQHNPHRDPAGVGLAVDIDKDGDNSHWLKALVVEPTAKALVEKGALRAFSVGIMRPRIVTDKNARGGRIVGGELGEISLVDRPANKNCSFTLVKSEKGLPVYVGDTGAVHGTPVPTPAVVARMLGKAAMGAPPARPDVAQGAIPGRTLSDPVAQRLSDALKRDAAGGRVVDSGGRDVSDVDDADFAGPGHTYPIKTQDDVSDAASLAHHADDPGAVRSRIRSIANRKWPGMTLPPSISGDGDGSKHVHAEAVKGQKDCPNCGKAYDADAKVRNCESCGADLPNAKAADGGTEKGRGNLANFGDKRGAPFGKKPEPEPGDGDEDDGDAAQKGGGLANFDGHRAKPFSSRSDAAGRDGSAGEETDADGDDDEGAEKNAGGAKNPGDTGAKYPNPNADGDPANNTGDEDDDDDRSLAGAGAENGLKCACGGCGGRVKRAHAYCPGCGSKLAWPSMAKGGKPAQISVEGDGDKDGDGDGLFDADGDGDGAVARRVGKGRGLVRGDGDPSCDAKAKDTKPVPGHREPDGPQTEIFEEDAGLTDGDEKSEGDAEPTPTWGPGSWGGKKTARVTDAPYTVMRAHDALCAAYHVDDVMAAYPSLKWFADALEPEAMRQAALSLANSEDPADWQAGTTGLVVAAKAADIAAAEPAVAADARALLSKAFTDMYPDVHLSPGECSPSSFKRPYLAGGHQKESAAAHGSDAGAPLPPSARPASSFTRGPLGDGHQAPSPGNTAQGMKAAPTPQTKGAGRHFYTNAARDNTHRAMQQVHDHIATLFPDVCPMSGGNTAPAVAKSPVSRPRRATVPVVVKNTARKGKKGPGTGTVAKAAAERAARVVTKQYRARMGAYEDELAALRGQLDALGSQPDPREAPIRSAATLGIPKNAGGAGPVERRSLIADAAETERVEKLRFLSSLASSGDPVTRESARASIRKMLG